MKSRKKNYTNHIKYLKLYNIPYVKFKKRVDNYLNCDNYKNFKKNTKNNSIVKFVNVEPQIKLNFSNLNKNNNFPFIIKKDVSINTENDIKSKFPDTLFPLFNNFKLIEDNQENKIISINSPNFRNIQFKNDEEKYEFEIINKDVKSIQDLIDLGKDYKEIYESKKKRFNLNVRVLHNLIEPLIELNNMVGVSKVKEIIFNKIIYHLQGLDDPDLDYNHVVLYGGPGMGKTKIAKIIGKIYSNLGILSKGEFKEAKLTDLKAGYVGQSEIKTQKLLEESLGNVLFLDEAYSLGTNENGKFDSYSQSIIDIINPFIEKYRRDFILIIAGYKNDLENRFFKGNQGLKSRFGLFIELESYTNTEMSKIFKSKIKKFNWNLSNNTMLDNFFLKNKDNFKFFGRDIENLFTKCKIAHSKRVIKEPLNNKKKLNMDDINNGYTLYLNEYHNSNKINQSLYNYMYL